MNLRNSSPCDVKFQMNARPVRLCFVKLFLDSNIDSSGKRENTNFSNNKSVMINTSYTLVDYLHGWWISKDTFPFAKFENLSSTDIIEGSWITNRYSGIAAV